MRFEATDSRRWSRLGATLATAIAFAGPVHGAAQSPPAGQARAALGVAEPPGQALMPRPLQQPDTLTLSAAARAALAAHPFVELQRAEQDRAGAAATEIRASRWPRLSTEWSATHFQEPMIVRPLHGFDPSRPPGFERTLVQGGLAASWLVWDGGARAADIERAEAGASAAGAGVAAAEAALIARVGRAYLAVLDARETAGAFEAQVAALEAERTRVLRFEAEGRAARVTVLRAEAALARAIAGNTTQRAIVAEREAELARLIGIAPGNVAASPLRTIAGRPAALPSRSELLSSAIGANAEVERARLTLAAAATLERRARAAFLPDLALAGRYAVYGAEGAAFSGEWQGGVQLSWPVFTGGQRLAASDRARAEQAAARQSLRLAELEVETALDRALAALAEADARERALDTAVDQYEAVVAVERLALDEGAGVQADLLSAQSALLETRAERSSARHARASALIELARLTGVLDLAWLTDNLETMP
jgi:outer membrane protein TolC